MAPPLLSRGHLMREQSDMMAQARNKVAALVSIAVLVLAMAGTFFWVEYEREAALEAARRYRALSVNLQELLIAIVDAETGQRGYLITGDDLYLEPYDAAVETVGARLALVEADLGDAALRDQLHNMVDAKLTELAQTVMLTQAGESREAVELMRTDRGAALMSALRTLVADIDARAEAERTVASARRDVFTQRGQVGTMGALLALSLLLMLVWFAIRRDLEIMGGQQQLIREQAQELAAKTQGIERALGTVEDHNLALARANRELEHTARDKQRAMSDLQRRNEDLDQFAYVTSHDLKAPLRAIGNLASWIEEDMPRDTSAEVRENLTLLRQRVARMERLIEGILTYSRAGRGATKATHAPRSIDATVEDARLLLGLDEARVQIVGGELPSPPQRTEFSQVLANLMSNADKHGGKGSRIFVEASSPSESELAIAVRDEGPGIDPRFHKRIFEIFQTLHPSDPLEGAGIGLAIVKKLVTGIGGSVWVESEPGQGATFRFTWPLADPPSAFENTVAAQATTPYPETARA